MAGIVAVTKFCTAESGSFKDYINYIDRDEAIRRDNLERFNLFSGYLGYMDNDEKTISIDYAKGTEKVSALFTKHRDVLASDDKKKLKDTFQTAQANGSNMWQTVISFDNSFLEELGVYDPETHTMDETKMIRSSRKAIDSMLAKEGLENAIWAASFHYNTDNIHIHIATVEPTPMREQKVYRKFQKDENGKFVTRKNEITGKEEKIPVFDGKGNPVFEKQYKGTFKNSSIKELKRVLASELSEDKDLTIRMTQLLRGIVADKREMQLLDIPDFKDEMRSLYEELLDSAVERRYWNYNQNSLAYLRPKLMELGERFIQTYHGKEFTEMCSRLEEMEKVYAKVYGGENNFLYNRLYSSKDGLYVRLGNAILKELRDFDKQRTEQVSAVSLASKYLDKEDPSFDIQKGLEILEKESDAGNTYAQNKLGMLYLCGDVIERDLNKARSYFEKSSASGNNFGTKMLQSMDAKHSRGFGARSLCERDFRKACRHLQRSLAKNYESWANMKEFEKLQHEIEGRKNDLEF